MKIAIVHDYLVQYGGAERVLEVVHEIWPHAPIFTLLYIPQSLPEHFKNWDITPTFVQRLPFIKSHYEKYFALFPTAIEQIDLSNFDVVLSISSAWAKGVITTPQTLHISYLLNPMRFAWEEYYSTLKRRKNPIYRLGIRFLMNYIRLWDVTSSHRIDHIITISNTIKARALKYYRRDSTIIYPPCNTDFFTPISNLKLQDYFLIVSRLKFYKRIDIAVQAFNQLGLPLLISGSGEMRGELERSARPNIQFLGPLTDTEIRSYYQRAQAIIFPGIEDFGIVALEAQACGTPVIAFKGGGAMETVIEGKTGLFFYPQTTEALIDVIKNFNRSLFQTELLRNNALIFNKKVFQQKLKDFVTLKSNECIDLHSRQ
ncbi:MAG: glycosyltransferase [Candidatus Stahlbacteria bacterium]|nr:glycosyltransferase [Candidatus Stahlbacteria bacterium]